MQLQSCRKDLCTLSSPSSFHCPGIMSSGTLGNRRCIRRTGKPDPPKPRAVGVGNIKQVPLTPTPHPDPPHSATPPPPPPPPPPPHPPHPDLSSLSFGVRDVGFRGSGFRDWGGLGSKGVEFWVEGHQPQGIRRWVRSSKCQPFSRYFLFLFISWQLGGVWLGF